MGAMIGKENLLSIPLSGYDVILVDPERQAASSEDLRG